MTNVPLYVFVNDTFIDKNENKIPFCMFSHPHSASIEGHYHDNGSQRHDNKKPLCTACQTLSLPAAILLWLCHRRGNKTIPSALCLSAQGQHPNSSLTHRHTKQRILEMYAFRGSTKPNTYIQPESCLFSVLGQTVEMCGWLTGEEGAGQLSNCWLVTVTAP